MNASAAARIHAARVFVLLLFVLLTCAARGHDIPDRIVLHGFVKPEDDRLHFIVRVPLVMLLNLNLPKRGPGFLALDHLDEALQRAADATARGIVLYGTVSRWRTRACARASRNRPIRASRVSRLRAR